MNKIDIQWYKALKHLSRLTTKEAKKLKNENLSDFRKYVPEDIENTLHQFGYIQLDERITQVVTQLGLQQLRDLEEINRKDITLIASVVAVILSLVALAKSMGLL